MKKLLLAVPAILLMVSCNRMEADRSKKQTDSLMAVLRENEGQLKERESTFNELITSFNEVERNLDSVAVRQKIISTHAERTPGEVVTSQKERINTQIKAINDFMESNRKTISDLRRKVSRVSKKNSSLEETVNTLSQRIIQKDQELAELNEKLNSVNSQLAQLQTSFDTLTAHSIRQGQTLDETIASLHTAYYIVGKPKELRDAKIIDKTGGLLGIGKTATLKKDFDPSKFKRIDYTQTSSIRVNSDHVKVVTNHPSDSYRLETDPKNKNVVTNLVIINQEKFWSVSKFLVVEGDPVKGETSVSSKSTVKSNHY